jgi:hypothetical protein
MARATHRRRTANMIEVHDRMVIVIWTLVLVAMGVIVVLLVAM